MGRPGIAVAAAGVLVAGLVWWGSTDQAGGRDPYNAASALVPPDGQRRVDDDGERGVRVSEQARLSGPEMVLTSPPIVGGAIATMLDGDPYSWRIWRTTETWYDDGEQATTLRQVTDRGIEQLAAYGASTLVFDPPLLEVPADVHAGSTWGGKGDATPGGGDLTYGSDLKADEADGNCLKITGSVDFRQAGESLLVSDTDEVWCPGRGIVTEPADAEAFTGSTEPQVPLAVGVEDWEVHRRQPLVATSVEDAADSAGAASLVVDFAPSGTGGDGISVANAQGQDALGFVRTGDDLVRAWVGHPGGTITCLTTAGQVTVVGTSRRELVAYGDRGQWLWSHRYDEVPLTQPLAADQDHLVTTTIGGDVVALDPASGEERWSHRRTDQVRVVPVTDGETVVVGDAGGRVAAYDVGTGDELWRTDVDEPGGVEAMAVVSRSVVLRAGSSVQSLDLDDGTPRWSTSVYATGSGTQVADLGGTVAVSSANGTVGLDVDTGRTEWEADGATVTLGLDHRLVQLDEDRLTVRDGDGHALGRWTVDGLRGTALLAPADAGVFVLDSAGILFEVGP